MPASSATACKPPQYLQPVWLEASVLLNNSYRALVGCQHIPMPSCKLNVQCEGCDSLIPPVRASSCAQCIQKRPVPVSACCHTCSGAQTTKPLCAHLCCDIKPYAAVA